MICCIKWQIKETEHSSRTFTDEWPLYRYKLQEKKQLWSLRLPLCHEHDCAVINLHDNDYVYHGWKLAARRSWLISVMHATVRQNTIPTFKGTYDLYLTLRSPLFNAIRLFSMYISIRRTMAITREYIWEKHEVGNSRASLLNYLSILTKQIPVNTVREINIYLSFIYVTSRPDLSRCHTTVIATFIYHFLSAYNLSTERLWFARRHRVCWESPCRHSVDKLSSVS